MAEKATKRTYKPRALSVPYEEDKAEAILQRLASGETLTSICQSMGIKPYHVYLWTEKDFSGFRQRFARARDFGSEVLEDEAVDIADGRKADCDETETESDSGFSTTKRRYDNVARSRLMADGAWKTEAGGSFFARSAGGQVTGYGAGKLNDFNGTQGFGGAIIIDDPLKPTDANSDPLRNAINNRWDAVIKSRFNSPKTPCIVIMQRIHEDDFCGMLTRDVEYRFTQVLLPAIIDEGTDHERALWPEKHSLERLHAMKAKNSYVFSSQMQQRPSPLGGGIIQTKWFGYYDVVPRLKFRAVFVDTAQKEKEHNDFQVASLWGLGEDGYLYLLDMLHARFQAYELEERIPAFWVKAKSDKSSPLRYMGVEDKASGTQLIQTLAHKVKPKIPVKAIQRSRSKLERVMDVQGYIESGYVKLPRNTAWLADFLSECEAFTADDTHAHDDQIDTMCDAISNMLIHSTTLYSDAF